jgi:2-C-methyl-D-erythritol 4-phosphate cytidylyltransferase
MIFAAILAGGVGSRMGGTDTPKQFLTLGDKPVIIHTIEKFVINSKFDKILVLSPQNFINHTNNLINEYFGEDNNIVVLEGGNTRNDTIINSINYIKENFGIDDDSIIVTHDSVRPFVTHRIIEDNINAAIEFGACDTVVPATDTIVESVDGEIIKDIPLRDNFYQGQTPQSFKINKLYELINDLSDNETNILTDACKIFVLKGEDVHLVKGEITNIKITYPYDLKLANTILKESNHD